MDGSYKASKEAFVSGMTGSSIGHVNMVSLAALLSIALHSAVRTRLPSPKWQHLPAEVVLLVLPLLLSMTLFANSPGWLSLLLLIPTVLLAALPPHEAGVALPSSHAPSRSPSRDPDSPRETRGPRRELQAVPPLAALTTYRSHMLLMTMLAILAVDFPVFPRALAKCETFGVSLMDIGVGSFVFSQGVVSAIPLVKDPSHLKSPLIPKLSAVLRKCSPLLLLGLLRTMSVKGADYPEHVTEYGVHWNFFITLAAVPTLQVILHPLMVYIPISLLGIIVGISHQIALSSWNVGRYVLEAPRVGMFSANKEGIISLTGYLAVHLLGVSTGTLILAPSPSYFRRRQQQLAHPSESRNHYDSSSDSDTAGNPDDEPSVSTRSRPPSLRRENDKSATELCAYAILWWVFLGCLRLLDVGGGVSRRMVNFQYIIWVAAYNTSFIVGYMVLDLLFFPSPLSKSVYSPTSKLKVQPDPGLLRPTSRGTTRGERSAIRDVNAATNANAPPLLAAINKNGLVLFLLANIATGLVNLTMQTMYSSDLTSMVVLSLYAFGISALAWTCRHRRLWRF